MKFLAIESLRISLKLNISAARGLNVIPLKELDYNLNKKEIRDAVKLPHDWEITDTPMICARGVQFNMDHAMVCQRGGFVRMADECVKYHSRLSELIANKKGESYSSAISWLRAKVSFAIVRSAILY